MKAPATTLLLAISLLGGCTHTRVWSPESKTIYLPGVRAYLQGFIDQHATEKENLFYLSPVSKQSAGQFVYAYWLTGNSVLAIQVPAEGQENYQFDFNHRLDLSEQVVGTAAQHNGQNYWVEDSDSVVSLLHECLDSGTKLVVQKNEASQLSQQRSRSDLRGQQ